MNKGLLLIFTLVVLVLCNQVCAKYWPIGEPKISFERALEIAKDRLKLEHESKHETISSVPLKNFIIVRAVYGTEDIPFDRVQFDNLKKQKWGWTFEFADFRDASVSATIRVIDENTVQLLSVTA